MSYPKFKAAYFIGGPWDLTKRVLDGGYSAQFIAPSEAHYPRVNFNAGVIDATEYYAKHLYRMLPLRTADGEMAVYAYEGRY